MHGVWDSYAQWVEAVFAPWAADHRPYGRLLPTALRLLSFYAEFVDEDLPDRVAVHLRTSVDVHVCKGTEIEGVRQSGSSTRTASQKLPILVML